MPHSYRVICVRLWGHQWQAYASSVHASLAEALAVFLDRQQEGFDSVQLVPGEQG